MCFPKYSFGDSKNYLRIWSYSAEPEGLGIVIAVGDLISMPSSSLEITVTLPRSLLDGDILSNFFPF